MNVTVCTSWSPAGRAIYGEHFLQTYREHWGDVPLIVVQEQRAMGQAPDNETWLTMDPDQLTPWRKDDRWKQAPRRNQLAFLKWGKKVLALKRAAHQVSEGWLVWLDADVSVLTPPDEEWWAKVLPKKKWLSCLLRDHRGFEPETGFVGYYMETPVIPALIDRMADAYTSGAVLSMRKWWDGWVFHQFWPKFVSNDRVHNLSKDTDAERLTHVWPFTVLASRLKHHKGPARKKVHYGQEEEDNPAAHPGPKFGL